VTFDKFVQLIELFCVIFCRHVRCINFIVIACTFQVYSYKCTQHYNIIIYLPAQQTLSYHIERSYIV